MAASLSINFNPFPSGAAVPVYNLVQQAFAAWIAHFDVTFGNYLVNVQFGSTVAGDASLAFSPLVTVGGVQPGTVANPTVVAPALGLAVAGRVYGSTPIALTLTIDNNYINGTHPVTDDLGAVEREFGHALGIKSTGGIVITGPVAGPFAQPIGKKVVSVYDRLVQTVPNSFNPPGSLDYGPNAQAAFGRPVPVNFYDTDSTYAGLAAVDSITQPASSLQPLDVALLRDSGIPVLTDQELGEHQVARLYVAAFGRTADSAGLIAQYAALRNGATLAQLGNSFVASTEFTNRYGALSNADFVNALYQNVLGRAGDAAGVALFNSALTRGVSRGTVLAGVADSEEERGRLNSNPNIAYASTAEAELARLYDAAFARDVDAGGFNAYTPAIINGTSLRAVAMSFMTSAEFTNRYGIAPTDKTLVDAYYENTLHRAPDTAGEAQYLQALSSGGFSRADLLVAFADSPEHVNALAQRTAARDATGFNLDLSPHLGLIPMISEPITT